MNPLISATDPATLWAVIAIGTLTAIWLEQRYRWAARLSGPVIALLLAMILSNTGVMPVKADVYDIVEGWLVPLALPLLLARANFREILRSGRGPLIAFHLACAGTLIGTVVAVLVLRPWLGSPVTEQAAGMMSASYIGGGVNFLAVKASLNVGSEVSSPLLVADNFVMAGAFVALLGIAGAKWFRARYPHPHIRRAEGAAEDHQHSGTLKRQPVSLFDIAQASALAFGILALASGTQSLVVRAFGDIGQAGTALQITVAVLANKFVHLTGLSLIAATVLARPLSKINGLDELGSWMLLMFLFVIGLPADLWKVLTGTPELFLFCSIIAVFNVGFTLIAGRLLKLNLEELLLAMNATLGGPPTAAAMAVGAGWNRLVLPGLLIGLWGYVIGTPLGILVAGLFLRK